MLNYFAHAKLSGKNVQLMKAEVTEKETGTL